MPTRPSTRQLLQLPISSFADWDRVGQIRGVIQSHEAGQFSQSASFADLMGRDDRISGVMSARISALLGAPFIAKPSGPRKKEAKLARLLAGDEVSVGLWESMAPTTAVSELVRWGIMLGIGVGEIVWRTDDVNGWVPSLKVWHPQFLRWDWESSRYRLLTRNAGEVTLPDVSAEPRSDGRWIVWCPYGYQYGWLRGLVRPLAMLYLARQWTHRDWSRYSEKHGQPTDKVYIPQSATPAEAEEFYLNYVNRGNDTAVALPIGENGKDTGYDVELMEATGLSYQSFSAQLSMLEANIAVAVLGQNLTTEVSGGSFAATQAHQDVKLDKVKEDAKVATCLRLQMLTHWASYNFGDPDIAPRPVYQVEPPADEQAGNLALKTFGEALNTLQMAGAPIDVRAMCETAGLPLLSEEEVTQEQDEADAAQADALDAPPVDENAAPDNENSDQIDEKLTALTRRALSMRGRPIGLTSADRRKTYADALTERAMKLATAALKDDVDAVRAEVDAAESFDDLRTRLVERYKDMKPDKLASLVHKANLMAHLGGRVSMSAEVKGRRK